MPKIETLEVAINNFRNLQRNRAGAIADTYDTLHGMVFVREIGKHYLMLNESRQDLFKTLTFCGDLISYNVVKLFERMCGSVNADDTSRRTPPVGPMLWVKGLLTLSGKIGDALIVHNFATYSSRKTTGPLLEELLNSYETLCSQINTQWADASISQAISEGYIDSDLAVFIHTFKLTSSAIRFHAAYRMNCEVFDDSYFRYIKECVDSMASANDTFLDQFRLLHQIPEALSIAVAGTIEMADRSLKEQNLVRTIQALNEATLALGVIVACLGPLVELMYPAEYHKFRNNLGGTSGSQSDILGGQLLRRLYIRVARSYLSYLEEHPSNWTDAQVELNAAFLGFRHHIYRWRDQHLQLPRNVLGLEATSLMGSRNAPEVAHRMSQAFERTDPLSLHTEFREITGELPPLNEAEERILSLTGKVTKTVFEEVEKRRGGHGKSD